MTASCTVYVPRGRTQPATHTRIAAVGASGLLLFLAAVAVNQHDMQSASAVLDEGSQVHKGHKLAQGLADALAKAASQNPMKWGDRIHQQKDQIAKPSSLFNPEFDADAPPSKFSAYIQKEKEMKQLQDRMDKQLQLKAKVAMLTSRETTSLAALKNLSKPPKRNSAKKEGSQSAANTQAKTTANKPYKAWSDIKSEEDREKKEEEGYANWTRGPPRRPGFKEITEAVEQALNHGDDPSKLLVKEKHIEKQYETDKKDYQDWKMKISSDMDGEV